MGCNASRAETLCVLIVFKGPCPVNALAPAVAGFCVPTLKTRGFSPPLPCLCADVCWLGAQCTSLTSCALVVALNSNGGGDLMKPLIHERAICYSYMFALLQAQAANMPCIAA